MLNRRENLVAFGNVRLESGRIPSQCLHFFSDRSHLVFFQIDDGDVRAIFREAQRYAAPDSLTCARDESNFSLNARMLFFLMVLLTDLKLRIIYGTASPTRRNDPQILAEIFACPRWKSSRRHQSSRL